jgi:GNAT superfamily N-acetyltransferase
MLIRKATSKDIPVLLEYEQGVISAERPFDPTLRAGEIHYYDIEQMILADHVEIVVAEIESKIVACGYARIEKAKPYLDHNEYAYLGFMFVHPDYRGRGLNAKIIDVLKAWVIEKGLNEMQLDVYNRNESAIRAYEKMGFKRHLINMRVRC